MWALYKFFTMSLNFSAAKFQMPPGAGVDSLIAAQKELFTTVLEIR